MFLICSFIFVFSLGFCVHLALSISRAGQPTFKKATGIGRIFFNCKDPQALRTRYQKHLGLNTNEYGAVFEWRHGADTTQKGFTQWSPFRETTKYFAPSEEEFLINYRVENLTAPVRLLRKENVAITDSIETYDYGKFVHILDPENNKIELWEPNDEVYDYLGKKMGATTTK